MNSEVAIILHGLFDFAEIWYRVRQHHSRCMFKRQRSSHRIKGQGHGRKYVITQWDSNW